jgi:hypothetical protein
VFKVSKYKREKFKLLFKLIKLKNKLFDKKKEKKEWEKLVKILFIFQFKNQLLVFK